jgi:hypothetical protein
MSFATINTPEMSRSVSVEELQAERKLCADMAIDAPSYVMENLQSPEGAYYGAEAAERFVRAGRPRASPRTVLEHR